ncbi:hypothetical protein ACFL2V_04130 [Pseudomonadota bacterium]
MENKSIWVLFTKSKPLPECEINFDGGDHYFVEVCVPAQKGEAWQQIGNVIERARECLLESHFELCDVSKCIRYFADEWQEQTRHNNMIHEAAQKTLETGAITLGGFRSDEVEARFYCRHTVHGFPG